MSQKIEAARTRRGALSPIPPENRLHGSSDLVCRPVDQEARQLLLTISRLRTHIHMNETECPCHAYISFLCFSFAASLILNLVGLIRRLLISSWGFSERPTEI